MDNRTIAQRVSYWRVRRGLTQPVFAGRLGRSVSWVKKVEAGDRQLDRLSVLEQIANVLARRVHPATAVASAQPSPVSRSPAM